MCLYPWPDSRHCCDRRFVAPVYRRRRGRLARLASLMPSPAGPTSTRCCWRGIGQRPKHSTATIYVLLHLWQGSEAPSLQHPDEIFGGGGGARKSGSSSSSYSSSPPSGGGRALSDISTGSNIHTWRNDGQKKYNSGKNLIFSLA